MQGIGRGMRERAVGGSPLKPDDQGGVCAHTCWKEVGVPGPRAVLELKGPVRPRGRGVPGEHSDREPGRLWAGSVVPAAIVRALFLCVGPVTPLPGLEQQSEKVSHPFTDLLRRATRVSENGSKKASPEASSVLPGRAADH